MSALSSRSDLVAAGGGRIPLSVLVQTKNEEAGIGACLAALGDFGEVLVVDSNSVDRTVGIARDMGVGVVNFTWDGQYPKKKQWQLDHVETSYDWVLFLDADETPTPELVAELHRRFVSSCPERQVAAFDLGLRYWFAGRPLRFGHRVSKRCLVRKGAVQFPEIDDLDLPGMGELEGHYQPIVDGEVLSLGGRLEHRDLDPVRTWFDRHNRYSDWEAHLRARGDAGRDVDRSRSRQGRIFAKAPFKSAAFFVYCYLARGGFLDGRAGFDYAIALSMYYWQIHVKVRELARAQGGTRADD